MVNRMSELFGYKNTDNLLHTIKSEKGNNPNNQIVKSMGNGHVVNNKSSFPYPKDISKSDKAKPEGLSERKKYRNYYDTNDTITTTQTTDPHDEDSVGYNRERIFEVLERNAEILYVANDGTDTLYVIISHEGGQNFARERPVYPGEVKTLYNVYELRLRSPTAGLAYRVTEYPICCNSGIRSWNLDFATDSVDVSGSTVTANAGTNLNTSLLALETGGNLETIKTNTETLNSLIITIQELASRIAGLASARGIASDIRVTLLSGTVTTVTGITNIGGIPAVQLIPSNQNMTAILSNIQNVVVS